MTFSIFFYKDLLNIAKKYDIFVEIIYSDYKTGETFVIAKFNNLQLLNYFIKDMLRKFRLIKEELLTTNTCLLHIVPR